MLRTDDRLLLSEALAPPPGHQPDLLVGTTYSMHLGALLSVPLGLTFADWEADDGQPTTEPVATLEAVRRHADRITVFCQAGATAASEQPPLVASWLEDVVVPVAAPLGGVFHPKVWVARYRNPDGARAYRLVCGSRNLTFDQSWDTVVVVDGAPTPRGGLAAETRPLVDFVRVLPSLAVGRIADRRRAEIEALADELRRVRFAPPDGFEAITLCPLGIPGHQDDPLLATRRTRMLVVSPFIGATRLSTLAPEQARRSILVSRAEELEGVATAGLNAFGGVYTLDEQEPSETESRDGRLSGLHAKLYVADAGWNAHVWTGSANATSSGFADNVEFLVRLDGRRKFCGVEAVLGDHDDRYALRANLIEAARRDVAAEPPLEAEIERELDGVARAIAERALVAKVAAGSGPTTFDVELQTDEPVAFPDWVNVDCWPMTGLGDVLAAPLVPGTRSLGRFRDQAIADLTAFYVLAIVGERDGVRMAKRVIVKAQLDGEPDGRREAILRDLLKDTAQVLRLLRALLAFDRTGDQGGGLGFVSELGGAAGRADIRETPLLESLLRALSDAPDRLEAIRSLLDELAGIDGLLPPELLELWEPFRTVYEERQP
ncbi:MAG TPA: phospholipase D family protein [Solirubrobacteraceae bacterium]|nr:phospholipase D family protein [Solirubrobacteraceae bacterium]